MKKLFIIHLLLAIPAAIAIVAAVFMFVIKLAEIGSGPTLSWGLIGGLVVGAVIALVLDVYVMFKHRPDPIKEFSKLF